MKKHELPTFESRAYTHVRHRRIIEFIRFPFDLEDKLFPASGYAHTRNRRTYIYIYVYSGIGASQICILFKRSAVIEPCTLLMRRAIFYARCSSWGKNWIEIRQIRRVLFVLSRFVCFVFFQIYYYNEINFSRWN